jgi:Holliday junction resolvase RusA-like endonuclease
VDEIIFTIPGEPVAQGRPKFTTRSGYPKAYDPQKSKDYKLYLRFAIGQTGVVPKHLLTAPLSVCISIFKSVPSSYSKRNKIAAEMGDLRPTTKPDVDNYGKAILDALNGLIWADDAQVVELTIVKWYSSTPRVEVKISEVAQIVKLEVNK